jgi:hypothetical protein
MNIIETNIKSNGDKIHDTIKYSPIEKQLFEILSSNLGELTYQLEKGAMTIFFSGIIIRATFKNSVKLLVISTIQDWVNDFEIIDKYDPKQNIPSTTLNYNKDITKQLSDFCNKVKFIIEARKKAKPIFDRYNTEGKILFDASLAYLNDYFQDKYIEVIMWHEPRNLFQSFARNLGFYIKPKNGAPADGVYIIFEEEGKVDVKWNGSTPERTQSRCVETVEKVFSDSHRFNFGDGVEGMKAKIKAIEDLQKKIEEFDYRKCPELVKLLEIREQANNLSSEIKNL